MLCYEAASGEAALAKWVGSYPSQAVLLAARVQWTICAADAIGASTAATSASVAAPLVAAARRWGDRVDALARLLRAPMPPPRRTLLAALLLHDVHARDQLYALAESAVDSVDGFGWARCLRMYWLADEGEFEARIA
jgi:hypothetical protein